MSITDKMVDKFEPVFLAKGLRAALEAVAPMLIAAGMREAASIVLREEGHGYFDSPTEISITLNARAQELDPDTSLYGAAKYGPGHDIR